jgi:hypothetical protein
MKRLRRFRPPAALAVPPGLALLAAPAAPSARAALSAALHRVSCEGGAPLAPADPGQGQAFACADLPIGIRLFRPRLLRADGPSVASSSASDCVGWNPLEQCGFPDCFFEPCPVDSSCTAPVPARAATWGAIKGQHRL